MHVVAVHPDSKRLMKLTESIRLLYIDCQIESFTDQMFAVKYGLNHQVDVLFTFINMRPLDGFDVARLLRYTNREMKINFIAENERGRRDAMRIRAKSYTVEPVTAEKLNAEEEEFL